MSDDDYTSDEEHAMPVNAPSRSHRSSTFDSDDEAREVDELTGGGSDKKHKADAQARAQARKESEKTFQNIMKYISDPPTVTLQHSKRGVAYWSGRSIDGRQINFRGVTGFLDDFIFPTPSSQSGETADVRSISVGVDYEAEANESLRADCTPCNRAPPSGPHDESLPDGCLARGRKHGILVHHQTQQLCVAHMNGKCPVNAGQLSSDNYDACALALLDFFRNLNYIHLANEIVVSHGQGLETDLDMATAVDMLFYVAGDIQETHAIELKTCSIPIDRPYQVGGKLRFPLMDYDDTPYNRHSAQVMLTIMLFEMHMGQDPLVWRGFTHFWLVYVNPTSKKVTRIGPAQWIYDMHVRSNMYRFMLSVQQGQKLNDSKVSRYLSQTPSHASDADARKSSSSSSGAPSSGKKTPKKQPSKSKKPDPSKSPNPKRRCSGPRDTYVSPSASGARQLQRDSSSSDEDDEDEEQMDDDW